MDKITGFNIGSLSIQNNVFLAPMDGYTDYPFRMIAKKQGAGIVFSEFINALDVIYSHPFLHQKIFFTDFERPFAYQIFDDSPERILRTAQILEKNNPDFIDINMGCSAKNVASRGAGAGLMREPEKIQKIFSLLKKNIQLPITGKIRLGWDENSLNYLEIAKIIQEEGADMLSVHGRTKRQAYGGKADWEAIAEIKSKLSIPVTANGDVKTVLDIQRIKDFTGCDAVMIGRAALYNPWIFNGKDKHDVSSIELFNAFQDHLGKMITFYGLSSGMVLFRKHIKNYLPVDKLHREERIELFSQKDLLKLTEIIQSYIFNGIRVPNPMSQQHVSNEE
jgi:nifR3 family TIM-barrel protein